MSESHAHDGQVMVNVFVVEKSSGSDGKYRDAKFIKRGWMPLPLLAAKIPVFIEDKQYNFVDVAYELSHREAMLFVHEDKSVAIVSGAAAALVPDVARYGASSH